MTPPQLTLVSLLLPLVASQFSSLSEAQVTQVKRKLRTVVKGGTLATALRLAFHDCVGKVWHTTRVMSRLYGSYFSFLSLNVS